MKTLHATAQHPAGGLPRRSYTIACLIAAGYVVVGAKGVRVPKKEGNGSVLRFLMPRAAAHWRRVGRLEATDTGMVLSVSGLNEVSDSLARSEGYHADAEAIAAFLGLIQKGETAEVAGHAYAAARKADFK